MFEVASTRDRQLDSDGLGPLKDFRTSVFHRQHMVLSIILEMGGIGLIDGAESWEKIFLAFF